MPSQSDGSVALSWMKWWVPGEFWGMKSTEADAVWNYVGLRVGERDTTELRHGGKKYLLCYRRGFSSLILLTFWEELVIVVGVELCILECLAAYVASTPLDTHSTSTSHLQPEPKMPLNITKCSPGKQNHP